MIGKKVVANYGAGYPLESGVVFQVHESEKSVAIEWDSGEISFVPVAKIKTIFTSLELVKRFEVTGPVGIFWENKR